jgi:uncharacterized protein YhaN
MSANPTPTNAELAEELEAIRQENEELREENRKLRETVSENTRQIDELKTQVEEKNERIDELENRVDELEDDVDVEWRGDRQLQNLWFDGVPIGKKLKSVSENVEDNIDRLLEIEEGNVSVEPDNRVEDDFTPIERMAALGEDIAESASDKRALTLFENFTDWASKTPRGLVLKSGADRVKTLMNVAREEDKISDWNQVYRAYESLEDLSDGYIEYVDDKKRGKMLVLEEPMPSMSGSAEDDSSPTASSVGA